VNSSKLDAIQRRSGRLGPHWVTVEWHGGKVAGVTLGKKCARDDRKLAKDLEGVLDGGRIPECLHVDTNGLRGFTRKVLGRCAGIRSGKVMTYSELAKAAGFPEAARAVGQVMARNPFALLIPCHRVVGSDRSLHGFGGGLDMKEWLLAREGWQFEGIGRGRRLAGAIGVGRSQKSEARSQNAEVRGPAPAAFRAGRRASSTESRG
jgi:methylated-DNA-[protein]-cysteine S-methyltransferase